MAGGQISPSPIDFHRRPYNTIAVPCERVKVFRYGTFYQGILPGAHVFIHKCLLLSFSALMLLVGQQEGHPSEWWGAGMVICLLMSLPLTVSWSRLVLPFWYWITRVVQEKGPLNVCVCVCLLHPKPDVEPFCITVPNFMKIGQAVAEIAVFRFFQCGRRRLGFSNIWNLGWKRLFTPTLRFWGFDPLNGAHINAAPSPCCATQRETTKHWFRCIDQRQQLQMKKWRGSTKTCLKQLKNKSPRGTCCS